jgi:tRNA A-37 threonylcarbamoyl transferase component Bud32
LAENYLKFNLVRPPFFWVTLSLGVVMLLYFAQAIVLVYDFGTIKKDWGWEYQLKGGKYYVAKITDNGSDFGKLQIHDQIIAINNDNRIEQGNIVPAMRLKLRTIKPNSLYTITVIRNNTSLQFELFLPIKRDFNQLLFTLSYLLAAFSFLVLGLLVGILKPQEKLIQFLVLTSYCTTIILLRNGLEPTFESIPEYAYKTVILLSSASPLVVPFLYEHCYRFNETLLHKKFWINLKYYFYLLAIVLVFVNFNKYWLLLWQGEEAAISILTNFNYSWLVKSYTSIYSLQFILGVSVSLFVVLHSYFHSHEPTLRRRIKWAVYGVTLGIFPSVIFYAVIVALSNTQYSYILLTKGARLVEYLTNVFLIICPITCAYAIIRYRHFDINFIIRRGLQYLLAKSSIYFLLVVQIGLIGNIIIKNPKLTVAEIFSPKSVYIYLLATTVFSLAFRVKVSLWLDRIFFRQAYNREQILIDLLEQIKQNDDFVEISKLVHKQINAALHPKNIHTIYVESRTQKQLVSNYDAAVKRDTKLFEILCNINHAQDYPFSSQALVLPSDEQLWLNKLEIKLIVPIKSTHIQLIGLMFLAEKSSEEPYSAADKKLLEAIANQLAVMHENLFLKEDVNKERKIKHEVLNRLEGQNINLVKECPKCGSCFDSTTEKCSKDDTELILSLPVERIIDEKYQLDRLIGKGGMGAVYEATDLRLNRKVAVKIMLSDMFGDQEALRRFEREAKASAKLNHLNIISIYDYGQLVTKGAYLVMEFLKGESLRSFLNKQGTLPPELLAELLGQIMEAIKAAHQAGVIHRDLKPENILITEEKKHYLVKVLDFGLAKLTEIDNQSSKNLTTPGTVMGTFGYMPLEQLSGEIVDTRADIFALGVITVEALIGHRPFEGRTLAELMLVMMKDDFQLETDENLKALNLALKKSLAKLPDDRYPTVEAMQQELIPLLQNTDFNTSKIYYSEAKTLQKKI